ncbi:MAG: class I SAM-dependent methyltransferase [Vicinamibacterales bacterium]
MPAAGRDGFLPLYDPFTRLFGFQRALRALIDQAELQRDHVVLDVGCGTGTLAVLIKRRHPTVDVIGLDPDPAALAIAQRKAAKAGAAVRLERGFGDALPFGEERFDRVFSSMMFHHLKREERPKVLEEIRRVLKPGGRLEFLDFSGARHSLLGGLVHGHQTLPAAEDKLITRMREAGFADGSRMAERRTFFGPIGFYQART